MVSFCTYSKTQVRHFNQTILTPPTHLTSLLIDLGVFGHVGLIGSQWAITAVSQAQFWPKYPLNKYGDGKVNGLISIIISDWFALGTNGKAAKGTLASFSKELLNSHLSNLQIALHWRLSKR